MSETNTQEAIAIIGAACRFPGSVSSLGTLWDMISHVRTGHGKVPSDRWDADIWHHESTGRKGAICTKHGYFLRQDIGQFDAPFFSTTAKEAAAMDPMKRLLLEVSYESTENGEICAFEEAQEIVLLMAALSAGIPVENLINSPTGCFVGCMTNDYEMISLGDIYNCDHTAAIGLSEAMTANRVSWYFGLKGPSLTTDTACSSSLYALHLACQSLRTRETNMSLVAGVNLIIAPSTMQQFSALHMLSPEGICHTFDDHANGYGRGEGISCIVIKRLSDALRDGDTIRAVIRGTGVNADGKTSSITQPSSTAQADLMKATYEAAGLETTSMQYFECHGTGTRVGDPIELEAIASTFGASRTAAGLGPLFVGSIKPNVGHTEGCSGLASLLKAIVSLEQGKIVPTYGVKRLNPKLKFTDWNIALPTHLMEWPTPGQRRISINSFSFGGTNAHAILDDAYHYLVDHGLTGNHSTKVHVDEGGSESDQLARQTTSLSSIQPNSKRLYVFSTKDQAGIIDPSFVFDSSLTSFMVAIKEATSGHGVDVVFHTSYNLASMPSLTILAEFGYFLNLDNGTSSASQLHLPMSQRNLNLVHIYMESVMETKPELMRKLFQRTFNDLIRCGAISPISPVRILSVSDFLKAPEVQSVPHNVTSVVSLDKEAIIPIVPPPLPELVLDETATYILAGGLGALGLDIANMMIEHGAKHLVFLSRSGGSTKEKELQHMRDRGVNVTAYACDIVDELSVNEVFWKIRRGGQVVKGVLQCAAVLEDSTFDNMTHAKWTRAVGPKIRGSSNLIARLWPGNDPFFIMISSIVGVIGNAGQANYAAGNTFEDALARHARDHLGIRATSIDAGVVIDSSHFTSEGMFGELNGYLLKQQHGFTGIQIKVEELLVVLKAVMRGTAADGQNIPVQLLVGLEDNLVRNEGGRGFEQDRKFDLRISETNGRLSFSGREVESMVEKLGKATTLEESAAIVEERFKLQVAAAIGITREEVDSQQPLPELGVDSLMAVEMRNQAIQEMQSDISVFELLSSTPLSEVAMKIATRSGLVPIEVKN